MNSLQLKFALILAFVIISGYLVIIYFGDKGLRDLNTMKQELISLKEKNEALQRENIEMHRKIQRLKEDPEFIKNIARKKFKMIGKDEIVFKFRDKQPEKPQMPVTTTNNMDSTSDDGTGGEPREADTPAGPVD